MGVYRTAYIIAGYKMPGKMHHQTTGEKLNVFDDETYLPYIEGWEGEKFSIIYDSMSGGYTVFGIILASFGDHDGNTEFEEIDLSDLGYESIKAKYIELFGDYLPPDAQLHPKIFAFNHYS